MVLSKPADQNVLKAFKLTGKVAAVTGGARGIGLEVSKALAEAHADVAIIYSTSKDAESIAAEIAAANNVKCKAYRANVTSATEIEACIKQIAVDFEKLDIMVANAGIATHYAAEDYTPEQFSEIMKVNLDGAFYTAQAAARIFKAQGSGNIVFTASVSAILVNVPQKQAAVSSRCALTEWQTEVLIVQRLESRLGAARKMFVCRMG